MSLLIRKPFNEGYTELANRAADGLKHIAFGVVKLPGGGEYAGETGEFEAVLTIASGTCGVSSGELSASGLGGRKKVFDDRATAVYLPPASTYKIIAGPEGVEIAVSMAFAADKDCAPPTLIRKEDVNIRHVGRDNWSRQVHDIVDGRIKAGRILLGETFNPPGNWSSAPPHCHDEHNPPTESDHEEVYWFKTNPEQGFGIIRVYTDDRTLDETIAVQNNDLVLIPRGYHPVAAGPGYSLYYLWTLAGDVRELHPRDDPDHTWIKSAK